jgi:hypothetical protein
MMTSAVGGARSPGESVWLPPFHALVAHHFRFLLRRHCPLAPVGGFLQRHLASGTRTECRELTLSESGWTLLQ